MMSEDTAGRLRARAASLGIPLESITADRLVAYYELLVRWNRTINLTGLTDPEEALDRLIVEPLMAARHLQVRPSLMDIGSGGGSPAIPLALALDAISLRLVESNQRKSAFLREAVRHLGLTSAAVSTVRVEELSSDTAPSTLISIRAVRPEEDLFRRLRAFLAPDGTIALLTSVRATVSPMAGLALTATLPLIESRGSVVQLFKSTGNVPRGTLKA